MEKVVIVGAARTPIGNFLGKLKDIPAVDLGVVAARGAMEQAKIGPELIEDVVAGMVYKEGVKGNPARQVQLKCGIPAKTPAVTVEQQCASGMRAMEIGALNIISGKAKASLVVGMENMSQVPHLLFGLREGRRLGVLTVEDALLYDALHDAFHGYHMGITAEYLAEKYGITRKEQDEYAFLSHQRAIAAIRQGKFKEEIVPVKVKSRKEIFLVDTDEHPREDISLEALNKLPPVFKEGGTVTAGNASGINDGAAALILMAEAYAKELGIKPLARILATATWGVDPEIMGIGPVYAIPEALKYAGIRFEEVDYFEINEAFAAQFLAVKKELKLNLDRVNVNGSGISLGHPLGCTGVRLVVTLIYEMQRRSSRYGVASLCAGGGPAMAAVLELVK